MTEKENREFVEVVAAPLCGIALAVIVLAMGAEITITIYQLLEVVR